MAQAIGPSHGGQTTKVHVLTNVLRRPDVIHLTPSNASDVKVAPDVLAVAPGHLKRLIADRDYDANQLRRDLKGSVRTRASKYSRCSRTCGRGRSGRFQDAQHRHGPLKEEQSAAEGGDALVAAGARTKVVAQLIVSSTEPRR